MPINHFWFAAPNPAHREAPFRHPSTFIVVKEIGRVGTDLTVEVVASVNPSFPVGQQSRRCCMKMRDCTLMDGKWSDTQTKADVTPMAHTFSKEVDPKHDDARGLIDWKYDVRTVEPDAEKGALVRNCFVLLPEKDPAALSALKTYAAACREPKLKSDLLEWIRKIEAEKLNLWREGKNLGSMGRINAGIDKPAN